MKRRIYLDSAGTTGIDPDVLKTYISLLESHFANSESLYDEGSEVHRMMEKARSAAAGLLGVSADEVIFTSGIIQIVKPTIATFTRIVASPIVT